MVPSGIMRFSLKLSGLHSSVYQVQGEGQARGFLVIHSLFRGSSRGGIRMAGDVTEEEVRLLAEGMTLKFGLLGLPQGGAKAGIQFDADAPREARLAALCQFGQAISRVLRSRTYIPGADMGTSNEMVRRMLVSLGIPLHHRELRSERSGHFTAVSVFSAARHAADAVGLKLAGARVAIEGFGNVGNCLAQLFAGHGARVVAISTSRGALHNDRGLDVGDLLGAWRKKGSHFVESYTQADHGCPGSLFGAPVEVLCPCARYNTITPLTAGGIQARIIAPGSNHPFDLATEKALMARGIIPVPDWVANCGGVLGPTMEFSGWPDGEIVEFIHRKLEPHVRGAIRESERTGLTPTEIAKPRALERFEQTAAQAGRPGLKGRFMSAGLEVYRRGLVPSALVRGMSRQYYERNVLLPFEY
jgi:glutamate dehydrogenase (NAD(P)+)